MTNREDVCVDSRADWVLAPFLSRVSQVATFAKEGGPVSGEIAFIAFLLSASICFTT